MITDFAECDGLIPEDMKITTNWIHHIGVAGRETVVEGGAGIKEGKSRIIEWEHEHK
jgi:hypothetical protein